MTGSVAASDN